MHPFLAYIVQWLLIPLLLCKPPWRPELPPPKASWCLFVPTCSPNPDVSEPTSVLSIPLPVPELGSRAQPRALRPALPGLRASHPRRGTRAGVRLPSGECRGPTGLDAMSQVSMDTHAEVLTGAGSGGGLDALRPPPGPVSSCLRVSPGLPVSSRLEGLLPVLLSFTCSLEALVQLSSH